MASNQNDEKWVSVQKTWQTILISQFSTIFVVFFLIPPKIGLRPDWGIIILLLGVASFLLAIPFIKRFKGILKTNSIIRKNSTEEQNIRSKIVVGGYAIGILPHLFAVAYYVSTKDLVGFFVLWGLGVLVAISHRPTVSYEA